MSERTFKTDKEFILGVKNWMETPEEEILKQVMEYTGFENYEFLYTSTKFTN